MLYLRPVAAGDPDPSTRCHAEGHAVAALGPVTDWCTDCGQRFPANDRPGTAPAALAVDLDTLAAILRRHSVHLPADRVAQVISEARSRAFLVSVPAPAPVPASV